jgi:hypothetical protein
MVISSLLLTIWCVHTYTERAARHMYDAESMMLLSCGIIFTSEDSDVQ